MDRLSPESAPILENMKPTQPDLFSAEPAPAYRPDLDKVRWRLGKTLAEARAAQEITVGILDALALPHHLPADDQLAAGRGGRAVAVSIRGGAGAACSRVIFLPDFAVAQSRLRASALTPTGARPPSRCALRWTGRAPPPP